jgi:hypothetical protein
MHSEGVHDLGVDETGVVLHGMHCMVMHMHGLGENVYDIPTDARLENLRNRMTLTNFLWRGMFFEGKGPFFSYSLSLYSSSKLYIVLQ